ncbi:MAG: 50S ribosomal protein L11 methyltransferase [Flavobacteriales bacterium]
MNKKDVIRFKKGLKVEFTDLGWVVKFDQQKLSLNYASLIILDIFSKWISIEEGTKLMAEKCKHKNDFFGVSSNFHELLKKGFFEIKNEAKNTFSFHSSKFDSFPVHVRMLNDKARTLAFQKAIRAKVTPTDIVLDIGTGNGILAATAAMCGAKHVYAIERTEFIEVARAVFKANGLENKITLIKGDSREIELPEKASVLISEIIGNDAFDEGILGTFEDAKKRLLTPNAKLIPESIAVCLQLLEMPNEKYSKSLVHKNNIIKWKDAYQVDFSAFQDFVDDKPVMLNMSNSDLTKCKVLSAPITLIETDFNNQTNLQKSNTYQITIEQEGELNGIHVFFEAKLSDENILSLAQDKISDNNHWSLKVFYLPKVKNVKKGGQISLKYQLRKLKSDIELL